MTIDQLEKQYKNLQSDNHYQQLITYWQANGKYSLSNFLLKVIPATSRSASHFQHLAETFTNEGRYLEADYFCKRWRASAPESYLPWRLTAIVAAKRCDFNKMKSSIKRLQELKAPENIQWMANILFFLVFNINNGKDIEKYAMEMLSIWQPDPIFLIVAIDVAVKFPSSTLFTKIIDLKKTNVDLTENWVREAEKVLRQRLIYLVSAAKTHKGAIE